MSQKKVPISTTTELDKDSILPSYDASIEEGSANNADDDFYIAHGLVKPTEEELRTLRKVAGKMPATSYWLCAVEFAERASYYGCYNVYKNFIRAPLPAGGNGAGATAPGSELTAGALGKGSVTASAMVEAFTFVAYGSCIYFGWLADTKYGRFKLICWGVAVCGFAHVLMIISSLPVVLRTGNAIAPFAISLYTLAIGASMFKPNISPTIMDQSPHKVPNVVIDPKTGDRVIIDPEASLNSVMLWFYLLINVGAMFGVATSYLAKDVGFWSAYLLPCILYFLLPPLLFYLNRRLIKQPPAGSELTQTLSVLTDAIRYSSWTAALPSTRRAAGSTKQYTYTDSFVQDVRRTLQACLIFLFIPIFNINDGGMGAAANSLTASMTTNGVPNDVLDNLNSISIVCAVPLINHVLYPALRKRGIKWGPISRMTFGFGMCTLGSMGYALLQWRVYATSPCGWQASTCAEGVSPVSYGWYALPTIITAVSEIFVNVTAYSIAYSRSPPNMKGLVASINLFMSAISAAIGLAAADAIQDPWLIWVFAGPTAFGAVSTVLFWWCFRGMDKEVFVLNTGEVGGAVVEGEGEGKGVEVDEK